MKLLKSVWSKIIAISLGGTMVLGVGLALNLNSRETKAAVADYVPTTLAAGKQVLIVSNTTAGVYYMLPGASATSSSPANNIQPTVSAGKISGDYDANLFTVSGSSGAWVFANPAGHYIFANNSNTGIRINKQDTVTMRNWDYNATNQTLKHVTNSRYLGVYVAGSDWRCYTTSSQANYAGTGENVVFYEKSGAAQTYTVSFNANGGTGSMSNVTGVSGSYTLPASTFTPPSGMAFVGWKAGGTGSTIAAGTSYSVTGDVTFHAQWAQQRTLTYNSNGGSGSMTDSSSPYGDGATVTVLTSAFVAPIGKTFGHWNTANNDSGTTYNPGATFTISANVTLFAIWVDLPNEIEIDYASYSAGLPASGYAAVSWSAGGIEGTIFSIKHSSSWIQFQANNSYVYNTQAISGFITSITIEKASGSFTGLTAYVGQSAMTSKPTSGGVTNSTDWEWTFDAADEYTYFRIDSTSSNAKYFNNIVVGYQKVETVDPEGIELDNSDPIVMDTYGYGRRKLSAAVLPFNANDTSVTWGSSNSSIVTVSDGVLTPVGTGVATVYATTSNFVSDALTPDLKDSVSVTVNQAEYKKATFVPTSTTALSPADDYLAAGSASISTEGSWNSDKSAIQLTSTNSTATFTISGYAGMKIMGIDLVMSSNGAAGSGALTVTAGVTEILSISTAAFADESWNGAYNALASDLYKDSTDYIVESGENIVLAFSASENSIYIHSIAVRYLDFSLEEWCQDFLDNLTCDSSGATAPSVSDWEDLGIAFLYLDEDLQLIAHNVFANESGTVIERAMAKYDYIVAKYGSVTYNNFIERSITPFSPSAPVAFNGAAGNGFIAVLVIALIAATGVGYYLFTKKRKEQD